jgi:uncharacterized Tic20 family protein
MAEEKEIPEPAEESAGEAGAEQPAGAEEPVSAEKPEGVQEGQAPEEVSKDARMWAMLCHLLAIFTSFIAPLIIWLVKKEEDPFIDNQGKEALNFQITVVIAMFVSGLLTFICIGFLLGIAVWVIDLVFCIMGTVKANKGIAYRYPVSIRFIK